MCADERLELCDHRGVHAEPQLAVHAHLERAEAQLLEPADLGLGELLVGDVGERGPAPHVHRRGEQGMRALDVAGPQRAAPVPRHALEDLGVELTRLYGEQVAADDRPQH
jgi:hypothetical protein